MKKHDFNKGWEFCLDRDLDAYQLYGLQKCGDAKGAPERFYEHNNFERIDLPHDWAVALPKDRRADNFSGARNKTRFHRYMTELRSNADEIVSVGWYRKSFDWCEEWNGKRVFLEFEGIYRSADFWVNGVYMDRHASGYTGFLPEITDQLFPNEENSVAVRVDAGEPEGWWYEGAGIYRNVHLLVAEPVYFVPDETVVKANVDGSVKASAILRNDTPKETTTAVTWEIRNETGAVIATTESEITVAPYAEASVAASLSVESPLLWHVDHPHLYTLTVRAADEVTVRFGFRSFEFDPDKGFFLNGEPLKLHGACVHQDFGGVGVALSDNLNRYKIARLKEMGVNAYRSAHHAPSPALLRACDELGMLVMDETRAFGTSPEALRQLESLIKRDRNHASVFIWSIGNEEFSIQNTDFGRRLAEKACRIVRSLDDTRTMTYGGNNGLHYEGINGGVPVRGVNYLRCGKIDMYHAEHPEQPIVGTEESSYVLSRGGIENDFGGGTLDSTGNVTMSWGSTPKGWVKHVEKRPWYAGGFMWTGFDYRGEPSPFPHTNVSSSFGTIDLCGMEKPPFYYYKAWWTDEPVLKLAPHWNHREGETASVTTFTNCVSVTLYLNGQTLGTKTVERFDAPLWEIPFEAGTLTAEGVTADGKVLRDTLVTAGETASVRVSTVLKADRDGDVAICELVGIDEHGNPVHTADEIVTVHVDGGRIVGVGNGDPASYDYEQKPHEESFRELRTFDFDHGVYPIPEKRENVHQYNAATAPGYQYFVREDASEPAGFFDDDFRIVDKTTKGVCEEKTLTFTTRFSETTDYEYIEFERLHGDATVYLDGEELGNNLKGFSKNNRPYRFYRRITAGRHELKVVTVLKDGSFGAMSGYVRLGKEQVTPWQVRLHYGKARVFVKPTEYGKPFVLHAEL